MILRTSFNIIPHCFNDLNHYTLLVNQSIQEIVEVLDDSPPDSPLVPSCELSTVAVLPKVKKREFLTINQVARKIAKLPLSSEEDIFKASSPACVHVGKSLLPPDGVPEGIEPILTKRDCPKEGKL